MFRINSHPDAHPEPVHTDTREPGPNEGGGATKTAPVSVIPPETAGFATTPQSGRPTGMAATFVSPAPPTRVTLPGDATIYYVKDSAKTGVPQTLYTRDLQTGVLKQTSKQVIGDGKGGWKPSSGLPGGRDFSQKQVRAQRIEQAEARVRGAKASAVDAYRQFGVAEGEEFAASIEHKASKLSLRQALDAEEAAYKGLIEAKHSLKQGNLTSEERRARENELPGLESAHKNAETQLHLAETRWRDAKKRLIEAEKNCTVAIANSQAADEQLHDAKAKLIEIRNSPA